MPKTLDRLHTDHQRLRNILAATSQIAGEYRAATTEVNSDRLFCMIDYLSGYPDKVHHPTEDLVFGKLLDLDLSKEDEGKVIHNQSQHNDLQSATAELKELFDSVTGEPDPDQLVVALGDYSEQQLKHMTFEEQEVFPLALQRFSPAAWEELDERFGKSRDPLFDKADKRYAALYRHLIINPQDPDAGTVSDALLRFLSATAVGAN